MQTSSLSKVQEALDAKLRSMRPRFVATVAERLDRLEELRDRFETAPGDGAALADLTQGAHKLAGVAGMFGAADLGDCARAAEEALSRLAKGAAARAAERAERAEALDLVDDLLGEMALIVAVG